MKRQAQDAFPEIVENLYRHRKRLPVVWILLSVAILVCDFRFAITFQFPVLFAIPVVLSAWFNGWRWALSLAVLLPLFRAAFWHVWQPQWPFSETVINVTIRISVFSVLAYLVSRVSIQLREIKVLRGLLPICSFCKKIRKRDEKWVPIEEYISDHSEADFSHGLCPECGRRHYPEFFPEKTKPE